MGEEAKKKDDKGPGQWMTTWQGNCDYMHKIKPVKILAWREKSHIIPPLVEELLSTDGFWEEEIFFKDVAPEKISHVSVGDPVDHTTPLFQLEIQ